MKLSVDFAHRIGMHSPEVCGYSAAQANIEMALKLAGIQMNTQAELRLAHSAPHVFERVEGKKNILWFPYEAEKIAPLSVELINEKCDALIASCQANAETFKAGGVKKPIFICQLGIDTQRWMPNKEERTSVFRMLWVGQSSERKGWKLLAPAFYQAFKPSDPVQLYMKSMVLNDSSARVLDGGRVILDTRYLPVETLARLYQSANAFIFPSRGEATGLPVLEAMASGALVAAPATLGLSDFIDESVAYPLPTQSVAGHYGVDIEVPVVSVETLSEAMKSLVYHYKVLDVRTQEARARVEKDYSIKALSERLRIVLLQIQHDLT